jgi:hypothetical protein
MPLVYRKPTVGEIVRVRTRHWLVEAVAPSATGTLVSLACVDDDAQGETAKVVWEVELDALVVDGEAWGQIGTRDFDKPEFFSAYLNTLRWNCITSTNEKLFQAPFRAGIRVDAYQLEPLRKALALPRVNLFIADDVGLGKTIEAGLIANELRLRRRVNEIVVSCPAGMVEQWQEELETRFGLTFQIYSRDYVDRIRRERGYGENPWTTFPRWIISHRLLIGENHAGPMKQWLDNFRAGSLLILDEAHHAAPASGSRYAIDSQITRAVRDLAPRFEHKIFLSAIRLRPSENGYFAFPARRNSRGVMPCSATQAQTTPRGHLGDSWRPADEFNTSSGGLLNWPNFAPMTRCAPITCPPNSIQHRCLAQPATGACSCPKLHANNKTLSSTEDCSFQP